MLWSWSGWPCCWTGCRAGWAWRGPGWANRGSSRSRPPSKVATHGERPGVDGARTTAVSRPTWRDVATVGPVLSADGFARTRGDTLAPSELLTRFPEVGEVSPIGAS